MCPISSSEIAALNGGYQQQTMSQMQYSQSIGQGNIYGGGMQQGGGQADQLVAKGMNRAVGVGVPLAAAGMSLMGLDPFSIGLKAAGATMPAMGMGGAAAVGAGVALPAFAAFGAAKYAGSQMMEGASQQSGLNQTLRNSFNFRNSAGGQGFQRQDMTEIGTMVRGMSEQFGPGGEITGFKELTTLAGKMGSMGFAQGVRDVKEFSSKFKEMVTTLKGMAKDLGTTLEGAMEFAQAAKGSGVFGMGNMAKFTGTVRGAAVSGGLAVSEVTAMASIGSQISRSIGGLGKQGAAAGVNTIAQVGNAQQMGILSEEDIYNVTGQTGAEGRQAYAASSLQKAGSFLQTGKGRRSLAAIAGKNGTLDEEGVQELLAGGMDIGETMRRDNKMKSTVGRANFIRNEGRLRGAALERIGAFMPALQLKEWAESKGVDINNMDDRSMLFAQRQLGMGRDEVDQAVKMANAMPSIAQRMQRQKEDDAYVQQHEQDRKQQGLEGVQNRFDQASHRIGGALQGIGQNIFNTASGGLNRFLDRATGVQEHVSTERADEAVRAAATGNMRGMKEYLGVGNDNPFANAETKTAAKISVENFAGGMGEELRQSLGYTEGSILHGKTGKQQFKDAGIDVDTSSQEALNKSLEAAREKLIAKASAGSITDKEKSLLNGDILNPGTGEAAGERGQRIGESLFKSEGTGILAGAAAKGDPVAKAMRWLVGAGSGQKEKEVGVGTYLTSEEGMHTSFQLLGGAGKDAANAMQKNLEKEFDTLKEQHEEKGERAAEIATQLLAKTYADNGGEQTKDAVVAAATARFGVTGVDTTRAGMGTAYRGALEAGAGTQKLARIEEGKRIASRAQNEMAKQKELGITDVTGLTGPSGLSKGVEDAEKVYEAGLKRRAGFVATGDPAHDKAAYMENAASEQADMASLINMSEGERKEVMKRHAGDSRGLQATSIQAEEAKMIKGLKRGGAAKTSASMLGLKLTQEQSKGIDIKTAAGQDKLGALEIEQIAGPNISEDGRKELKEKLSLYNKSLAKGDVHGAEAAFKGIQENADVKQHEKEKTREDENNNPALRMQKEGNDYLKVMAKKMIGATDLAAAIKANHDAEDGGKSPTGPSAGAVH